MTRTDDLLDRLTAGITALCSSEQWQHWLRVQARFHPYSFANTVLIRQQRPEATQVAGFHTWRRMGRQVRRGETGIRILAPIVRRADTSDSDATVVGFRAVVVFDLAQTDGDPLPVPVTHLDGDDPADRFGQLAEVAGLLGYTVERAGTLPDGVNGMCIPAERRILVSTRNRPAHQLKTLAHELAHAVLHTGPDRPDAVAVRELEAESVAWIVCDALGVDASGFSFGYVTHWAGGGVDAVEAIRRCGTRIQRTAHQLLAALPAG
jgi:hypothetical protein